MGNQFEQQNLTLQEDIDRMQLDPAWEALVQKKALEFLQTEDAEYFNREFTGEIDHDGYLIRRDGENPNTKPFGNIGGGLPLERVIVAAKAEFEQTVSQ